MNSPEMPRPKEAKSTSEQVQELPEVKDVIHIRKELIDDLEKRLLSRMYDTRNSETKTKTLEAVMQSGIGYLRKPYTLDTHESHEERREFKNKLSRDMRAYYGDTRATGNALNTMINMCVPLQLSANKDDVEFGKQVEEKIRSLSNQSDEQRNMESGFPVGADTDKEMDTKSMLERDKYVIEIIEEILAYFSPAEVSKE